MVDLTDGLGYTNGVSHQLTIKRQDEIVDVELLVPNVDQTQFRKIKFVSALMNDDALDSLILKNIFQEFAILSKFIIYENLLLVTLHFIF